MPVVKPPANAAYLGNMARDGMVLLLDAVTPGAAAAMGFYAAASLPTTGIIALGSYDGVDLYYAGDASTTDIKVRVTGFIEVYNTTTTNLTSSTAKTPVGFIEVLLNGEAATNGMSALTLGAAFGTAIGSGVNTTGYLWALTPTTSTPGPGVSVYVSAANGIGFVRVAPSGGYKYVRVQATAVTGGTKVSVFARRIKGDTLNK